MSNSSLSSPYLDHLSHNQRFALAYAPKPGAFISACTCAVFAIKIFRDKEKMSKMYHRLALGLCTSGAFNAVVLFFSSWAVPSETPGSVHGFGSTSICTLMGFLNQISLIVPSYYVSLAIYIFFALRHEFRTKEIKWMEKYIHCGVFIFPLLSAVYLTNAKMFNPIGFGCYINSSPMGCDIIQYGPCMRGSNPALYFTTFYIFPISICLVVATITIIMCFVCEHRKHQKLLQSGALRGKQILLESARRQKSILIAKQGICYLVILYVTYIFPILAASLRFSDGRFHFPSLLLAVILLPLQGLFFTIAYQALLYPRPMEIIIEVKDESNDQPRKLSFHANQLSQSVTKVSDTSAISKDTSRNATYDQYRPKRRTSKVYLSIFEEVDQKRWNQFAVYLGSSSDEEESHTGE